MRVCFTPTKALGGAATPITICVGVSLSSFTPTKALGGAATLMALVGWSECYKRFTPTKALGGAATQAVAVDRREHLAFHSHQSFGRRCDGSRILPALGEFQSPTTPVFSQNPDWVETLAGLRNSKGARAKPNPVGNSQGVYAPRWV